MNNYTEILHYHYVKVISLLRSWFRKKLYTPCSLTQSGFFSEMRRNKTCTEGLIHPLFSFSRCHSQTEGNQYSGSFLNMQTEAFAHSRERLTLANVPCTRLDQGTAFPPPSHRACSVPIIPSVQASDQEDRAEERSITILHYKDGASTSQPISSETEIRSLSNCSQGPHALGNQTKHKSLVTYTTALGPRTESTMAKSVVSITVLGSRKECVNHSPNLSKSTGRLDHQQVQSTHEAKELQGAALHNSLIRRERDCHLSTKPKGLSSLTTAKSWLDKFIGLKNLTQKQWSWKQWNTKILEGLFLRPYPTFTDTRFTLLLSVTALWTTARTCNDRIQNTGYLKIQCE